MSGESSTKVDSRELLSLPLEHRHIEAGARMVGFAGWNMPVQYTGIIQEHNHTRTKAALFDTSHMGELFLRGTRAPADLDRLVTCKLDDLAVGRARYGFMLTERGGILDDLIVYRTGAHEFFLVVNASNTSGDLEHIAKHISNDSELADVSAPTAMLSLQGPLSTAILAELLSGYAGELTSLPRFAFINAGIVGTKVMISRTGYTGERGYELFVGTADAEKLWDLLISHPDVLPAGLGARDTLRLEMGYPLHGNDIDVNHTPIEANLERFVDRSKQFIGKRGLLARSEPGRLLTGFVCDGRRSARPGYDVFVDDEGSDSVGNVTSGGFSPSLKKGIGLCYIERSLAGDGRKIILKQGAAAITANIKTPPVIERGGKELS